MLFQTKLLLFEIPAILQSSMHLSALVSNNVLISLALNDFP